MSRSMTTEVSSRPFAARLWPSSWSGAGLNVLVDVGVDIGAEALVIDARGIAERGGQSGAVDEPAPPEGDQFADRVAVPGDNEGFALVEAAHDFTAAVAKFALADLSHARV